MPYDRATFDPRFSHLAYIFVKAYRPTRCSAVWLR